ncbi:hypothetical protein GCM10023178_66340 [Actinomadura luteofluorescens]
MADNWVETTAGDLRRWSDERGEALDEQGVRILLDLAREEMGLAGPEALEPRHVRELLLEVFPESVVAARDDVPTILDALRRIVAYLRDTGAVPAAAADGLEAEIERTGPGFAEVVAAVDSEERQAAAEVVAGLMQADGIATPRCRAPSTDSTSSPPTGRRGSSKASNGI